ncbi:hypothetical protein E2986_12770 [Frieseomelitta varia]|uniref:OAR domain-containing protein n=1 Tax=Frieseomelitta varia TaxID=561572 RepID=A0A833S4C1_9HYME|nr:hypothetical protein E2986_12770 [Frieseomelitta varia]
MKFVTMLVEIGVSLETFFVQSSSNADICRFRFRSVAGPALGLPGDPWLTPPGLLSALPGFLAAPHTGYPSYLTSPRRLPSPPNVGAVGSAVPGALSGGMTSIGSGGHVPAAPPSPPGHDPRTTSIQALRMRAKEHVESITKGLQMMFGLH